MVLRYINHLNKRELSYASANAFRCWLVDYEASTCGSAHITKDKRFLRVLQGYRNTSRSRVKETTPITRPYVCKLLRSPALRKGARFLVALGYGCMLRHSEARDVLDGESWLQAIHQPKLGWMVHLRKSKTDKLGRGDQVFIRDCARLPAACRDYLNEIAALQKHGLPLDCVLPSPSSFGGLLRHVLGTSLNRPRPHGLRHGHTVDLLRAGIKKETVRDMGRWHTMQGMQCYVAHHVPKQGLSTACHSTNE